MRSCGVGAWPRVMGALTRGRGQSDLETGHLKVEAVKGLQWEVPREGCTTWRWCERHPSRSWPRVRGGVAAQEVQGLPPLSLPDPEGVERNLYPCCHPNPKSPTP